MKLKTYILTTILVACTFPIGCAATTPNQADQDQAKLAVQQIRAEEQEYCNEHDQVQKICSQTLTLCMAQNKDATNYMACKTDADKRCSVYMSKYAEHCPVK